MPGRRKWRERGWRKEEKKKKIRIPSLGVGGRCTPCEHTRTSTQVEMSGHSAGINAFLLTGRKATSPTFAPRTTMLPISVYGWG